MNNPSRHELKFVVHHSVKSLLLARWSRYLTRAPFTNEYAVTPILSQYYDSPSLRMYHEKLDGIGFRSKVRLRVYDQIYRPGTTAFLEIKFRHNDLIQKVRRKISNFQPRYLDPAHWTFDDPVQEAAFENLLQRYRLRPSAQVYYQREAYEGIVERDVRVTIDTNLLGLFPGEVLTSQILRYRSRNLMPDTLAIVEVKATGRIPKWLREGVLSAELQQKTVPKYITAVEFLGLVELSEAGVFA